MKLSAIPLSLKAGGLLGFFAMGMIGWNLADRPSATPENSSVAESSANPTRRPARPSRPDGPATAAGKRLDVIRAARTPEGRMRATIEFARTLSPSEFAAWLDGGYFTLRGGPEHTLFNKIIRERWQKEDPEGLLMWSLKNGSSSSTLTTWAEKEPQRVIDFFKNYPDDPAELRALGGIARNHPDLALRRLQEMAAAGISMKGMPYTSSLIFQLAEKSPAALEAALDTLPAQLKKQAETALVGQRLNASFATEIRELWDRPDGWKIFETNAQQKREIGVKIFDELANLPPAWKASIAANPYYFIDRSNAVKWMDTDLAALGFTAFQQKSLRQLALSRMASAEPELALKRLDEFELEPSSRANVISNVISSANGDPEKVEALIALLDSEEDRKIARDRFAARSGESATNAKVEKPAEWLEKIASSDPRSGSSYSYFSVLEGWDQEKISELNSQFKSMPADRKQQVAGVIASGIGYGNLDPGLAGEAIRYLVTNPVEVPEGQQNSDTNPVALSSTYAVQLAVRDPGAASEWVGTLPAGEAKLWAQKNLASNWVQYDPKAVDQWLKTLPADARTEVRNYMNKPE